MKVKNSNTAGNSNKPRHGVSIYYGERYVGYIILNDRMNAETLEKIQKPANLEKILKVSELRPFKDNDADTADDLLAVLEDSDGEVSPEDEAEALLG